MDGCAKTEPDLSHHHETHLSFNRDFNSSSRITKKLCDSTDFVIKFAKFKKQSERIINQIGYVVFTATMCECVWGFF